MIRGVDPQDPVQGGANAALVDSMQSLGWIDQTALGVLLVFFVLGLFKGLIWQVSRIGILVAAYLLSGRYGNEVADWLARPADPAAAPDPSATTLYLAYCLLFVAVLIVLSLLAMLLQKLAVKAGLGFFDRLGGGVLGIATGGCIVLCAMFFVLMFFRGSQLAAAAEQSQAHRLSRFAVDWMGPRVPPELRQVFALPALAAPAAAPATMSPDEVVPAEASHRADPPDGGAEPPRTGGG